MWDATSWWRWKAEATEEELAAVTGSLLNSRIVEKDIMFKRPCFIFPACSSVLFLFNIYYIFVDCARAQINQK